MHSKIFLAALSAGFVGTVVAEDAPHISGNPTDVAYKATLPEKPFFAEAALDGNVKGSIFAQAPKDGNGVKYTVKFENLPKEGGPFAYHIHVNPALNGNCTSTLGHLDPYERGDKPACDASQPQTCQVGDLSGKYGKITQDPFTAEYLDPFTSTTKDSNAYFGARSFVIHYANGTRLTCADFESVQPVDCSESAAPATSTPAPYTTDCPDASKPTSWQTAPSGTGGLPQTTGSQPTSTVPVTAGAASVGIAGSVVAAAGLVMMAL